MFLFQNTRGHRAPFQNSSAATKAHLSIISLLLFSGNSLSVGDRYCTLGLNCGLWCVSVVSQLTCMSKCFPQRGQFCLSTKIISHTCSCWQHFLQMFCQTKELLTMIFLFVENTERFEKKPTKLL